MITSHIPRTTASQDSILIKSVNYLELLFISKIIHDKHMIVVDYG